MVKGSHVHCKYGNISETVQDRDIFLQTTDKGKGMEDIYIAPFIPRIVS